MINSLFLLSFFRYTHIYGLPDPLFARRLPFSIPDSLSDAFITRRIHCLRELQSILLPKKPAFYIAYLHGTYHVKGNLAKHSKTPHPITAFYRFPDCRYQQHLHLLLVSVYKTDKRNYLSHVLSPAKKLQYLQLLQLFLLPWFEIQYSSKKNQPFQIRC